MVLDGLAADEEPIGDLGVRHRVPEQLEDLGLPLGQHACALLAGRHGRPEGTQHRRCGVGVPGCLKPLEALECRRRLRDRDLRALGAQRVRELESRAGELHRHLRLREARKCFVQTFERVTSPRGEAHPPASERRGRAQVVNCVLRRARFELLRRREGVVDVVVGQAHLHQQRPQRLCRGAQRIEFTQRSFEDVAREHGIATGEVERSERSRRLDIGVESLEKLLRLLEATLPDP